MGSQRELATEAEFRASRSAGSGKAAQAMIGNRAMMKISQRGGLPTALRSSLEDLGGVDLSGVRVHYGSSKPKTVGALAYTQGADIHLGPGQEKHLAHEAWHAVQQIQGRVAPTIREHGVAINDDPQLEREADVMGQRASDSRWE